MTRYRNIYEGENVITRKIGANLWECWTMARPQKRIVTMTGAKLDAVDLSQKLDALDWNLPEQDLREVIKTTLRGSRKRGFSLMGII